MASFFFVFVLITKLKSIDFLLSVLKRKLIDDPLLPKQVKLSFFNNAILEQITKLYGRHDITIPLNVPSTLSTSTNESSAIKSVSELAHSFLLELCCFPGKGICQQSEGLGGASGSTSKVKNRVVLKWLLYLKPSEHPLEMKALLTCLENCVDLIPV